MFQIKLAPLRPKVDTSGMKWPQTENEKTENLNSVFFGPSFLISETSSQKFVEMRAMLCIIV